MKKDQEEEEHWPRITKEKVKLQWLQTDWSRFVDEDEEDEKPEDMSAPPRPPPAHLRSLRASAASEHRAARWLQTWAATRRDLACAPRPLRSSRSCPSQTQLRP